MTYQRDITSLEGGFGGFDAVEAFLREWKEKWTICEFADAVPIECNCLQTTACLKRNGLPEEEPDTSDEEDVGELQALAAEAVVKDNIVCEDACDACDCKGPKPGSASARNY